MGRFTDRYIKNLKPATDRYEQFESQGFGIRVFPSGAKSWIFTYSFGGRRRRLTFGTYPEMSLAEAHERHGEARALLRSGIDPGAQAQAAAHEERQAPTVEELAREYLERWAKPHKRTWQADERSLRVDVLPAWGSLKAKDIRRRDVIALLDGIVDRGSPIQANRTLAVIRKMYNFAVSRDIVSVSPCTAVRMPSEERRKDRTLTEDEITTFWLNIEAARLDPRTIAVLKLVLITAQRSGEVCAMRWDEIDGNWCTIPAERSKNGFSHRVPLSTMAEEVFRQAQRWRAGSPYVFPSPRGDQPIAQGALGHGLKKNIEVIGIAPFTPHDLRRTAASHMAAGGIPRLVISKILNHVERGVTAVYDRHSYDAEKRQALDAWGRKLEAIITGQAANVVTIKRTG